jgi:hypothetical protein
MQCCEFYLTERVWDLGVYSNEPHIFDRREEYTNHVTVMWLGLGITMDNKITWCQKVHINSEWNPHMIAGAFTSARAHTHTHTHTHRWVYVHVCVCVCDDVLNICQHMRYNNNENTLMWKYVYTRWPHRAIKLIHVFLLTLKVQRIHHVAATILITVCPLLHVEQTDIL